MSARRFARFGIAFSLLAATVGLAGFNAHAGVTSSTVGTVTTWTVTCTGNPCAENLNQVMEDSKDGDVIVVGPGTYKSKASTLGAATSPYFYVRKNVTYKSSAGAATTILQADHSLANDQYAFRVFPHTAASTGSPGPTRPNGAVIDGFTIQGAAGGVIVMDTFSTGLAVSNVTLRNLTVRPDASLSIPVQGIQLVSVSSSTLDSNTLVCTSATTICPYQNGILDFGGSSNVIISNTVQGTTTQHAIALQGATGDVVAGNSITGAEFHGIILRGTTNSRIERNSITGHKHDGITVSDDGTVSSLSKSNYIGQNRVVSTSWANHITDGTGLWLNGGADGNMAFGNDLSGEPEAGISVWASSYNHILANRIHNNYQGGMLIWQLQQTPGIGDASTTNNLIRSNFVYNTPTNGAVILRDVNNTDIAFNAFSGANFPGDAANPATAPDGSAYSSQPGGIVNNAISATQYFVQSASVYGNMISGMVNNVALDKVTTNANVYRNRFFGWSSAIGVMDNYAITPAGVNWDGGAAVGGNYWENFAVTGNPSTGSTPFTDIFCPTSGGCPYKDNYPFQSETLGQAASVNVTQPRSGATIGAGTTKTIAWSSQACSKVDIDLMSGATPVSALVANYPDTGYYIWNVASGLGAGSYSVRVTCKNFAGTSLGVTGASGTFTVAASGLALLSPGPMYNLQPGAATVAIARSGAGVGTAVSVFISVNGAAETSLGTIPAGSNTLSVTLPTTSTNTAAIRITDGTRQDGSDGYFSIVRSTGQGLTTALGSSVTPGSRVKLQWISCPGSKYVDIDVLVGASYQTIAQNVPDFGVYEWFVSPSLQGSGRNIRLTYRTTPGGAAACTAATSGTFSVSASTDLVVSQTSNVNPANSGKDVIYTVTVSNSGSITATNVVLTDTAPAGTLIWSSLACTRGATTVTCNVGSLAPGASASYQVVLRPAAAGSITNTASVALAETDANTLNNTSTLNLTVNATPAGVPTLRYRLYNPISQEHLYTTDLNEYNVLGAGGVWQQEGTVGKVLNNPGSFNGVTATPYYRLYNNVTLWHHWTTDANEYYTLLTFPGWGGEGVDGYLLPSNTTGATQLYRLVYPDGRGLHHWTIDATEYNILINTYGWVGEGGSGFVVQ